MYTICFAVTLVCIGVTHASVCCFPKQYEANQGLMKATVKNGQLLILYGNLHYWFDGVSRREVFIEDLTVDGYNTRVTVLKDYNVTNTKYVISGNHCTQKSLTPFKEGCIPDWATKLTSSSYGLKNSGMNFSVYNNSASTVTSFLIASEDCFPILDISAIPTGSSPYMQVVMPYNFTLGILDHTVFDIPAICKPSSPVGK
ncbi:uncharacterized protein LOC123564542 [Mercenaria mercenaria]|uniref:uncharacterized protein LOC123564542 n=1 Tax=Mercenaria mercenaria TaxID=6596 RepID=UPI00234E4764|nr:uncharacterized protein LOC123564542 [Mercenaria mercenaria]XP_053393170.1 uncharacterized protein LOC123564542 [Mercenaria mercenaria]